MSFGIILQFTMQTTFLVVIAILFLPIINNIAFSGNLFSGTTDETKAHRDALWSWTIIIFIGAMAGNVIWFFRALQREEAGTVEI